MLQEETLSDARKMQIAESFAIVRKKMQTAGAEGREVSLLAATKYVSAAEINYAIDELGLRHIGENRVQELLGKYDFLHLEYVTLHFIGTLQSNKVKYVVGKVALIHSVDSRSLAAEIEKQAAKRELIQDILVEINVCDEESKSGISLADLPSFLQEMQTMPHIRVRGLMTMGKKGMDAEAYARVFSKVREAWEQLRAQGHSFDVLSMGMSDSYEIAIACGSNMVRVGTALFGARQI